MTTEKTSEYILQWRPPVWMAEPVWGDYMVGNLSGVRRLLERCRRTFRDGEWRVVHRSLEITVIDDV